MWKNVTATTCQWQAAVRIPNPVNSDRAEWFPRPAADGCMRVFERPLDWVMFGGYAGFFGANQDVVGFSSVGEVGGGLEFPLWPKEEHSKRLQVGGSYLIGPNVTGWIIMLGLRQ